MRQWVEDCQENAGRIGLDGHEAARLHIVEVFLRWLFAKGHPSHGIRLQREADLGKADLQWLERMSSEAFFTSNNLQLLKPTYPGVGDFRQFISEHYPNMSNTATQLYKLLAALENQSPRPIRLIPLIKDLGLTGSIL